MGVDRTSVVANAWPTAELAAVEAVVRRVVAKRVHCHEDVDDLVQDAFVRLDAVRERIGSDALLPYAAVVARNLANSQGRAVLRSGRLADLALDLRPVQDHVGAGSERDEERVALRTAVGTLAAADRDLLVARDVDGASTTSLAEERGMSPGSVRVQLTRIRSKLRLEFLLTFRRIDRLPSVRCRPVLLAISNADVRRQAALSAAGHLALCPVCSDLSRALLARSRAGV